MRNNLLVQKKSAAAIPKVQVPSSGLGFQVQGAQAFTEEVAGGNGREPRKVVGFEGLCDDVWWPKRLCQEQAIHILFRNISPQIWSISLTVLRSPRVTGGQKVKLYKHFCDTYPIALLEESFKGKLWPSNGGSRIDLWSFKLGSFCFFNQKNPTNHAVFCL